jgi:hypothetical protein
MASKITWRKCKHGYVGREDGIHFASIERGDCDDSWYGFCRLGLDSASLREIARKVDVLNAKDEKDNPDA